MKRFALLIVVASTTTACLGSDFEASIEGSWQLTSGTVDGAAIPIIDSHPITIDFQDGEVGGTASCNHYGGTYQLSGSSISFGVLAMTEMACFPEETMEAEALYAAGLSMVDEVAVTGGELMLSGETTELVFEALEPVPDAELTDTVWLLDGLISGDAVSSVSGERATLEFFTDGSVLGGTGCRTLSGQYVISGAEVAMTELAALGEECPPDLQAQDDHVLSTLEGPFRVEIDGNRLTIRTRGDQGVSYVAEG